jgi:hypothetical protein
MGFKSTQAQRLVDAVLAMNPARRDFPRGVSRPTGLPRRACRGGSMLKWLFHRKIRTFEGTHDYDASYLHEVLDTDGEAFMKFGFATGLGRYRKDAPLEAHVAAGLTSSMHADCGPCTQLGVGFALEAGVASSTVAAIIAGDEAAMPPDAALAARFARAVIARDPGADLCREEITRRWGPRALLSLTFAIMAAQLYPTLKYALGHGKACTRVIVGEQIITPSRAPSATA